MDVSANITGIHYNPLLCSNLRRYSITQFEQVINRKGAFILDIDDETQLAISRWVSAKRTRSYPYARVYDTLGFQGKKVTIIPALKDEGKGGDRDYLQWDTISLMSLLGVYTIITFYSDAEKSNRYKDKITNQKFDGAVILKQIDKLLSYQSDALHWNLEQVDYIDQIIELALDSYTRIEKKTAVKMHSLASARERLEELRKGKSQFIDISRKLAKGAQERESVTIQPKENISAKKAKLTITNYLGGEYFLTCDEVYTHNEIVYLVEAKHSTKNMIPSLEDIKDGLLKMVLLSNLKDVSIKGHKYSSIPVLKLTSSQVYSIDSVPIRYREKLNLIKSEAEINNFYVIINDMNIKQYEL